MAQLAASVEERVELKTLQCSLTPRRFNDPRDAKCDVRYLDTTLLQRLEQPHLFLPEQLRRTNRKISTYPLRPA